MEHPIPAVLSVLDAARLLSGKADGGLWLTEMLAARNELGAENSGLPQEHTDRIRTANLRNYLVRHHGRDLLAPGTQDPKKDAPADLSDRERTSLLNTIGALLELVKSPRDGRESNADVIRELLENYSDKPGISKTTLEATFANARRRLNSA